MTVIRGAQLPNMLHAMFIPTPLTIRFCVFKWPHGPRSALHDAFLRIDRELVDAALFETPPLAAGTCALIAVIKHSPEGNASNILVGTLGDSRAVLSRGGKAHSLSPKQSPSRPDEKERIERAGGWVVVEKELCIERLTRMDLSNRGIRERAERRTNFVEVSRVNGELGCSRALGDVYYKLPALNYPSTYFFYPPGHPCCGAKNAAEVGFEFTADLVIAEPEWVHETCQHDDEFVILACDGLWDVIDEQEAVDIVIEYFNQTIVRDAREALNYLLTLLAGGGVMITDSNRFDFTN